MIESPKVFFSGIKVTPSASHCFGLAAFAEKYYIQIDSEQLLHSNYSDISRDTRIISVGVVILHLLALHVDLTAHAQYNRLPSAHTAAGMGLRGRESKDCEKGYNFHSVSSQGMGYNSEANR